MRLPKLHGKWLRQLFVQFLMVYKGITTSWNITQFYNIPIQTLLTLLFFNKWGGVPTTTHSLVTFMWKVLPLKRKHSHPCGGLYMLYKSNNTRQQDQILPCLCACILKSKVSNAWIGQYGWDQDIRYEKSFRPSLFNNIQQNFSFFYILFNGLSSKILHITSRLLTRTDLRNTL